MQNLKMLKYKQTTKNTIVYYSSDNYKITSYTYINVYGNCTTTIIIKQNKKTVMLLNNTVSEERANILKHSYNVKFNTTKINIDEMLTQLYNITQF